MPISRLSLWTVALPAFAVGGWWWLGDGGLDSASVPDRVTPAPAAGARSEALARVRATCRMADLDAFVEEQRQRVAAEPGAAALRVLAEALYERVLARDLGRGFSVGGLVPAERWAENRADVEAALDALARARAAGDDGAAVHRLEAGLRACQLTDLGAVLRWRGEIERDLETALALDPHDGHVHTALGCRLLFVPRWLGQDPAKALEHFRYAARALPLNERPQVFAAFACHLLGEREECLTWLRAAEQRNPRNPFVRAVLGRIAAGEERPFERDLN